MAGRLKDKVAVVTGAAPRGEGVGNGMATAVMFAREGAKVVLVNRSAERADKLAKQIKDEGGEAAVFAGDVAKADAAEAMAEFAAKKYGRLDILHNNVGIGAPGTPETVTLADWHKVLEANLTTTMLCTKYCLPRMKEGGGGSIIMVSSIAGALGLIGSPGAVAYATAKAGLHGFTMSVAVETTLACAVVSSEFVLICWLTADWVTPLIWAALVKLSLSAKSMKTLRLSICIRTRNTILVPVSQLMFNFFNESRPAMKFPA